MQKTFVMIKPDGVHRGLIGEIITRLERRGLKLAAMKMLRLTRKMAQDHYKEHLEKAFYPELEEFITSGPVIAMVWEGENAVSVVRQMMGPTDPAEAAPGTIRGDYALEMSRNVVHGSDSPASAEREISLYFTKDEISMYNR